MSSQDKRRNEPNKRAKTGQERASKSPKEPKKDENEPKKSGNEPGKEQKRAKQINYVAGNLERSARMRAPNWTFYDVQRNIWGGYVSASHVVRILY